MLRLNLSKSFLCADLSLSILRLGSNDIRIIYKRRLRGSIPRGVSILDEVAPPKDSLGRWDASAGVVNQDAVG